MPLKHFVSVLGYFRNGCVYKTRKRAKDYHGHCKMEKAWPDILWGGCLNINGGFAVKKISFGQI